MKFLRQLTFRILRIFYFYHFSLNPLELLWCIHTLSDRCCDTMVLSHFIGQVLRHHGALTPCRIGVVTPYRTSVMTPYCVCMIEFACGKENEFMCVCVCVCVCASVCMCVCEYECVREREREKERERENI